MFFVVVEELGLPITVDDYCQQVNELQKKIFPANTVLLPGNTIQLLQLHIYKIKHMYTHTHTQLLMCSVIYNYMLGAEKLIRHLHKHKVPIAVASGAHIEEMELKLTKHKELFSLFHHSVCSSSDPDITHGKPAPDCFLVAAKRFPNSPDPEKVNTITLIKDIKVS